MHSCFETSYQARMPPKGCVRHKWTEERIYVRMQIHGVTSWMWTCEEAHAAILFCHLQLHGSLDTSSVNSSWSSMGLLSTLGSGTCYNKPHTQVGEHPLAKPSGRMGGTGSHSLCPSPIGTRDKSPFPSLLRKTSREAHASGQGSLSLA